MEEIKKVLPIERQRLRGLGRHDGRRPGLAIDQGKLTEQVTRFEHREQRLFSAFRRQDDPHLPVYDDVEGVPRISLVADDLTGPEGTGSRSLLQSGGLLGWETREEPPR
jgi:hypothetical protein